MTRVWFNRTFSSIHAALALIRKGDTAQEYQLVVSSPNPQAIGLLAAHESASEPAGLIGLNYIEWCLDFCRDRKIDIFVPGKEASLVTSHNSEFRHIGTRVMSAASQETLHLLHNKARFYATTLSPNAPPPEFSVFERLENFDRAYASLRDRHSELCMKPSVSVYGIGFRRIIEDRSAFDLLMSGDMYRVNLHSLRDALAQAGQFRPMLLMEYLGGHEFSVDCVADRGVLVCAVARRKSLKAGGGQNIVVNDGIQVACADLVSQFGLNGNVNVQFREGKNGLRVLEINPRMSGGIAMASLGGPNLPYLGLVIFDRGRDAADVPPITTGLRVGEVTMAVTLQ